MLIRSFLIKRNQKGETSGLFVQTKNYHIQNGPKIECYSRLQRLRRRAQVSALWKVIRNISSTKKTCFRSIAGSVVETSQTTLLCNALPEQSELRVHLFLYMTHMHIFGQMCLRCAILSSGVI